ncbi:MAG: hypothetical protein ACRDQ7_24740 [Haloechinothrix sp.]
MSRNTDAAEQFYNPKTDEGTSNIGHMLDRDWREQHGQAQVLDSIAAITDGIGFESPGAGHDIAKATIDHVGRVADDHQPKPVGLVDNHARVAMANLVGGQLPKMNGAFGGNGHFDGHAVSRVLADPAASPTAYANLHSLEFAYAGGQIDGHLDNGQSGMSEHAGREMGGVLGSLNLGREHALENATEKEKADYGREANSAKLAGGYVVGKIADQIPLVGEDIKTLSTGALDAALQGSNSALDAKLSDDVVKMTRFTESNIVPLKADGHRVALADMTPDQREAFKHWVDTDPSAQAKFSQIHEPVNDAYGRGLVLDEQYTGYQKQG